MSNVYHHDTQTWKHVKNLGWLIAHKNDVTSLSFARSLDILGVTSKDVKGIFQAELSVNGRHMTYQTEYASLAVCRWFCNRPSWSHLTLKVY